MLISFAGYREADCVFVFAYAKSLFSHNEAHLLHMEKVDFLMRRLTSHLYLMTFLNFKAEHIRHRQNASKASRMTPQHKNSISLNIVSERESITMEYNKLYTYISFYTNLLVD